MYICLLKLTGIKNSRLKSVSLFINSEALRRFLNVSSVRERLPDWAGKYWFGRVDNIWAGLGSVWRFSNITQTNSGLSKLGPGGPVSCRV